MEAGRGQAGEVGSVGPCLALPPDTACCPGPPGSMARVKSRQAPEEQGPSAVSDPGQARDSGEESLGEPRTSPLDNPQP